MSGAIKQLTCSECNQPVTWTVRVISPGCPIPGGRLGYEYCRLFYLDDEFAWRLRDSHNVWGCDSCKRFGIIDRRTEEDKARDAAEFERLMAEHDPRQCWRSAVIPSPRTMSDVITELKGESDHD